MLGNRRQWVGGKWLTWPKSHSWCLVEYRKILKLVCCPVSQAFPYNDFSWNKIQILLSSNRRWSCKPSCFLFCRKLFMRAFVLSTLTGLYMQQAKAFQPQPHLKRIGFPVGRWLDNSHSIQVNKSLLLVRRGTFSGSQAACLLGVLTAISPRLLRRGLWSGGSKRNP